MCFEKNVLNKLLNYIVLFNNVIFKKKKFFNFLNRISLLKCRYCVFFGILLIGKCFC